MTSVEDLYRQGRAAHRAGKLDAAESLYARALEADPGHLNSLHQIGVVCLLNGKLEPAEDYFKKVLVKGAENGSIHANYGILLDRQNRFGEALIHHERAIDLDPENGGAWNNRGLCLTRLGRHEEALKCFDKALALKGEKADRLANRGVALEGLGRLDEAMKCFEAAIDLDPEFPGAWENRGRLHLLLGQLGIGWKLYEWRKKRAEAPWRRNFNVPEWTGVEPLFGKRILVHPEQGLGDTIQFSRFLDNLSALGAHVLFAPHKALRALMRSRIPAVELVDWKDQSLQLDYHIPLLSLPAALGLGEAEIGMTGAYLAAEPERVMKWQDKFGGEGFRIGICWQGHKGPADAGRSFDISRFELLSRIPGVRLISLHKGLGEDQLETLPDGMKVETLGEGFDAAPNQFLDTAAVMECCDLVITSDTSIAHLAGALGRPVWVALKHVPDWRWLLGRSDSPWYPSMRLFRQPTHGDWDAVFADIERALKAVMVGRPVVPPEVPVS